MSEVDYDEISRRYDRHRRLDPAVAEGIMGAARPPEGSCVLELGCGTGGLTLHLERLHGGPIAGLDRSRGMLSVAAGKLDRSRLVRGDALSLPFGDGAFSLVTGVFFIHHVPAGRLDDLSGEVARVLSPGGAVAIVTTSHAQIDRHHLNRAFPSFAQIDKGRFPDIGRLQAAFVGAGLAAESSENLPIATYSLDETYLHRLRARHISTFELMTEAEFRSGLKRYEEMLAGGELPREFTHYGTLVVARRPGSRIS